jgi:hypothetical protein
MSLAIPDQVIARWPSTVQKIRQQLHVAFADLPVRHMAALLEPSPLGTWNAPEEGCDHDILRRIVSDVDDQRGHGDAVESILDVPVLQLSAGAGAVSAAAFERECRGNVQGIRDAGVGECVFHRAGDIRWHGRDPADVHRHVKADGTMELGGVLKAVLHALLHPFGHLHDVLHSNIPVRRDIADGIRKYRALKASGRTADKVLGEHLGAPRVSEYVEIVLDVEVPEKIDQLVHHEVDRPERCWLVGGARRAAVTELVLQNHGAVHPKVHDRRHVVVSEAWSAVQDDERPFGPASESTSELVPSREGDIAEDKGDGALLSRDVNCIVRHVRFQQCCG